MPDIKQPLLNVTYVVGTLPAGNGGTGWSSYTVGDMLYADTTTTLAKLADVAVGSVLVSGGVGAAPAWSSSPSVTNLTLADAGVVTFGGTSASFPAIKRVGNGLAFRTADDSADANLGVLGLSASGALTTSLANGNPGLQFVGAAGTNRYMRFYTVASPRWDFGVNNTAEGGANAGTDLVLNRFSDAGAFINTVLTITRSTGAVVFNQNTSALPPTPPTGTNIQVVGVDGAGSRFLLDGFGVGNSFSFRLANGTNASKTAVTGPQNIGGISALGYDGSNYTTSGKASVLLASTENWSSTAQGARVVFATTANGGTATSNKVAVENNGDLTPMADNSLNLGTGALRWKEVFAGTGTINTSDARMKKWLGPLSAAELAVAKRLAGGIGTYQWLASLEEKGEAARIHVGVLAQDVQAAFEAEGLDAHRYGMFTYDEWEGYPEHREYATDESGNGVLDVPTYGLQVTSYTPGLEKGNRYGIRYSELTSFILAAQEQRLAAIEARSAGWWAKIKARLRPAAA